MKPLFAITLAFAAGGSAGAQSPKPDYQSCDLATQRMLTGETGGGIRDAGQAHVSMRANILEADLGSARKGRRLTQRQADGLFGRVEQVRTATNGLVKKQGFLSSAERASYDRELDAIATRICHS